MGEWDEREHPRNPEDGKFVDKVGTGGWASKLAGMIGQGRGHTGPVDSAVQQRREDVLDALNPEAAHRREYTKLLTQLEYSPQGAQEAIDYHLKYARSSGLSVPVDDTYLDDLLTSEIGIAGIEPDTLADRLDAAIPDWRFRFPETSDRLDEILDLEEED